MLSAKTEPELFKRAQGILEEELRHLAVSPREARAALGAAAGLASQRTCWLTWSADDTPSNNPTPATSKAKLAVARALSRIGRAEGMPPIGSVDGTDAAAVVAELLQ